MHGALFRLWVWVFSSTPNKVVARAAIRDKSIMSLVVFSASHAVSYRSIIVSIAARGQLLPLLNWVPFVRSRRFIRNVHCG